MTSSLAPLPLSVVEIEVNTRCNRRCAYCPNAQPTFRQPERRIDEAVFERIIDEIAAAGFTGRLSFHLFNEPLLHPRLEDLVARARARLPRAFFVLYSNGDLLDDRRHQALLDAGIDRFFVTRHDSDAFPDRPYQEVQWPVHFPVSGRGGTVAVSPEPLAVPCFAPSEMLIVTVDGDVLLCHEDAERRFVMGNLMRQSLREIWFGEAFTAARRLLEAGARAEAGGICRLCDIRLYPIPGGAI